MSTNIFEIFAESHLNLALTQIKLLKYEQAIDVLTQLIHYQPTNVKAFYLRAKSATCIQEYELALKDFKIALSLRPQEADLFRSYIKDLENTLASKKFYIPGTQEIGYESDYN